MEKKDEKSVASIQDRIRKAMKMMNHNYVGTREEYYHTLYLVSNASNISIERLDQIHKGKAYKDPSLSLMVRYQEERLDAIRKSLLDSGFSSEKPPSKAYVSLLVELGGSCRLSTQFIDRIFRGKNSYDPQILKIEESLPNSGHV